MDSEEEDMNNADKADYSRIFYPFGEIDFGLIAFIVVAGIALILLVQRFFPWVASRLPGRFRLYILPLAPILRIVIVFCTVLVVTPLVIKPTARNFFALFGALGLALGFAFKDYVSGLIAGLVAIYEQPYRTGDWVSIDGVYGEVQSMGLRSLRIVTPDDTMVTIPHSKIWNGVIHNANNGKRDHMCVTDFYLHPVHNGALVRQKLQDVALTSPYLQLKRPITVVTAERPWGTHYRLKAYPVDGREQFPFTSDLTVRGKAALSEIGVQPAATPVAPIEE